MKKYYVYYEVYQWEGELFKSFNNREDLEEFLNQHKEFFRLEVIYGVAVEVVPKESVLKWKIK